MQQTRCPATPIRHRLCPWQAAVRSAVTGLLLGLATTTQAVSVLAPGDIAIIGYNGQTPDTFSFATLVPIDAGVAVRFQCTGGNLTWTVPVGGVPAGAVGVVSNPRNDDGLPASVSLGGTMAESGYDYASDGDVLVVYQGATAIYASESQSSYTPPAGLSYQDHTVANHPVGVTQGRNGRYLGPRSGVRGQLLSHIANMANWEHNITTPYTFSTPPYNTALTIEPGAFWTSTVLDGAMFVAPGVTFRQLSALPSRLDNIRVDADDATTTASTNQCLASISATDTIAGRRWFSVYFTNTVPAGAAISSAKIRVQHQGLAGQSGNLEIHVSPNRLQSGWYTNALGNSSATSAVIPWVSTETETIYDAAAVLDTAEKLNNCEVLVLNRFGSGGSVYFDTIQIEAIYQASGQPQINNDAGASPIQASSATLNGALTQGAPNPRVLIAWGDEIGGTVTSQWDRIEDLGTVGVGSFARAISGLLANKTYYYRSYASNTLGEAWAPTNAVFTTSPPALQFTAASASQAEATTTLNLSIVMNATSTVPVSFTVAPGGGTATAGSDYTFATTNITIPAGRVSTNVFLRVLDDALDEADETAVLALSAPVNVAFGANSTYTLTILDNDATPTLSFTNLPASGTEGSASAVVTVRLSAPSGRDVSVQYQTQNDSALAGSDYTSTNGTLQFIPGSTQGLIAIPLLNDSEPEPVEFFNLTLSNPVNATIAGINPVSVAINDNDLGPPQINNNLGAVPVSSNAATLNGEMESTGGDLAHVRIYYGTTNGGTNAAAWANNVYMGTLNQGAFSNRVTGLTTNTTYHYRIAASNGFGLAWSPYSTNFLTGPPTLRFTSGSVTNAEAISPVALTVALSSPAVYGDDITFSVRRSAGSATEGTDFSFPTTNGIIRAGVTSTNVTVLIVSDALDENNERFDVSLATVAKARVGVPSAISYVIEDDDALPLLSFVGAPYSVSESGTSITVRVNLSPVSGRFVDVNYTTVDASAIAGDDYLKATGRLTWSTGDSSTRSIVIPILNDGVSQGDRYFEFRLTSPGFAAFATSDRENITILEDDATPPQVNNTAGASGVRGSMALLNGRVTDGIPFPQVRVYWGTSNGGTNPAAWTRTNLLGQVEADFSLELRGLAPSTTYFYRSFASNAAGSDWADTTATFQTTAGKDYFVNDNSRTQDVYCTAVGASGNSGLSAATPKDSIQAIIDTYDLNPGDTVFIDTGLYPLSNTLSLEPGDTGAAGISADVLFRGTTNTVGSIIDRADFFTDVMNLDLSSSTQAYVTFDRLEFKNGQRGIRVLGDSFNGTRGVVISRCVVRDNYAGSDGGISLQYCHEARVELSTVYSNDFGIYVRNCDEASIVSNRVFLNTFNGIRVRSSIAPTIAYNETFSQNDGILVTTGFGGEQVLFNTSYSNANDGITVNGDAGRIHGNRSFANGNNGISLTGAEFELSGNASYRNGFNGIDTSTESGLVCINNLIYLNTNVNVSFWGSGSRVRFEHNTLYGGNGIYWDSPTSVTNRYNIIWTTDPGHIGIDVPNIPGEGAVMLSDRNCLYATTAASAGRWGATACSGLANWQSVTWKDPNSMGVNPLFVDIAEGDFHLQSRAGSYHGGLWNADTADSPCIDAAGVEAEFGNEPPYNGLLANMGAYGNTAEASKTYYTGPLYTVNLVASPAAAGSVHISPASSLYPTNRLVTIWSTITNQSYSWIGWTGSLETDTVTNSFFVTANLTITALFETSVSNTNGVPSWWLSGYGLPDSQTGADADTDGDGLANWKEYYAGTVPTNALSVLAFSAVQRTPSQRDALTFKAVTGKLYRVALSSNLATRNWSSWPAALTTNGAPTLNPIAGTGSVMTLYVVPPAGLRPSYRVNLDYTP